MIQYVVIVGALAQLLGSSFYVWKTVRGEIRPNRVSFLMWSIAPLIATAAAFIDGARWVILPVFMSGFGPLLIFIASFVNPKSYWGLSRFDYVCGFFSFLALILWWLTSEPLVAIIFAILSDGVAAIPTLLKAWQYPKTETVVVYFAGLLSACLSFFAIKTGNISEYIFSIYLITINIFIIFTISRRGFIKFFSKQ